MVGGIVAALFAILPSLFDAKFAAHTGNGEKIVRFKFFGDRDHTGNEKCQEQDK